MLRCRLLNWLLISILLIIAWPACLLADEIQSSQKTGTKPEEGRIVTGKDWQLAATACAWPDFPRPAPLNALSEQRLRGGEILVESVDAGATKFVLARICIEQSPAQVWPILTNPFEFENKICTHMKSVEMITDRPDWSIMRCVFSVCFFLPKMSYTVESKYNGHREVQFRRLAGTFKDFRGCWMLRPLASGNTTEVIYSMSVDPGMPLPKWLVREALESELPHTLVALRERVNAIYAFNAKPELRHSSAAGVVHLDSPSQLHLAAGKSSI